MWFRLPREESLVPAEPLSAVPERPTDRAPIFDPDAAKSFPFVAEALDLAPPGSSPRLSHRRLRVQYMQTIGRYRILRTLGQGAMGTVFLAEDPQIERRVAIKVISAGGSEVSPEHRAEIEARFMREAKLAGRLTHPNIVAVYDVGTQGGTPWIAMEFIEGSSLSERMRTGGTPLTLRDRVEIVRKVAAALAHAHARGVIHRDIKPANVMVSNDGEIKVADFGIGKKLGDQTEMTRTGTMVGSPSYMSPEQIRGEKVDHRSDVFSLGVVLYELVTGTRPFPADTITTLVYQILNVEPPDPSTIHADLPGGLGAILRKALAKNVSDRYPSADEMAADLGALAASFDRDGLVPTIIGVASPSSSGLSGRSITRNTAIDTERPPTAGSGSHPGVMPTLLDSRPAGSVASSAGLSATQPTVIVSTPAGSPPPASSERSGVRPPVPLVAPPVLPPPPPVARPVSLPPPPSAGGGKGPLLAAGAALALLVIAGGAIWWKLRQPSSAGVDGSIAATSSTAPPVPVEPPPPSATSAAPLTAEPPPGSASGASTAVEALPPLPPTQSVHPTPPAATRGTRVSPSEPSGAPEPPPPVARGGARPPEPEPEPAVESASLFRASERFKIDVDPDQARLQLDGRPIGISNDWDGFGGGEKLTFPPGRHRLRISLPGYRDETVTLIIDPSADDDEVDVDVKLEENGSGAKYEKKKSPSSKTSGPVLFEVSPADATVSVDGRPVGRAGDFSSNPLRLDGAPRVAEIVLSTPSGKSRALRVLVVAGGPEECEIKEKLE
jgi:serine/threonine-protein kinase